jgi:hypothetical protein
MLKLKREQKMKELEDLMKTSILEMWMKDLNLLEEQLK